MMSHINPKLRDCNARICANCKHWHTDQYEKWGQCDVALNSGTFHNHHTGSLNCKHTNSRYRSQKGCKTRFEWKDGRGMDIREKTGIIIKKNGLFLVAYCIGTEELRWSSSPWDAWITRDREAARFVSDRINGVRMLFNPVAGQLRGLHEK